MDIQMNKINIKESTFGEEASKPQKDIFRGDMSTPQDITGRNLVRWIS